MHLYSDLQTPRHRHLQTRSRRKHNVNLQRSTVRQPLRIRHEILLDHEEAIGEAEVDLIVQEPEVTHGELLRDNLVPEGGRLKAGSRGQNVPQMMMCTMKTMTWEIKD